MSFEHLSLKHRKELSTCLLGIDLWEDVIANHIPSLDKKDKLEGRIAFLREDFNLSYLHDLNFSDSVPLDQQVRENLQDFINYIKAKKDKHPRIVNKIISNYDKASKAISCERCTGGKSPCNGYEEDKEKVADSGECLSHLFELFNYVVACAEELYTTFTSFSGSKPKISFATSLLDYDTSNTFLGSNITGYCRYIKESTVRIGLSLDPSKFTSASYYSVMYILFHEIVIHAYQHIESTSFPERSLDMDAFSEGWMDWIALEAMEYMLIHSPIMASISEAKVQNFITFGKDLHRDRTAVYGVGQLSYNSYRRKGASVAKTVSLYLKRLLNSFSKAELYSEILFSLSFNMNLRLDLKPLRDNFVDTMYFNTYGTPERIDPKSERILIMSLKKYLNDRDTHLFLETSTKI